MKEGNKNIRAIFTGILTIILANIYGHYTPSFFVFWQPAFLIIIIAGVNYSLYKKNFRLTILYNFALLIFDDVLIRLYARGIHDHEGDGWIALFFILTYLAAILAMIVYAFAAVKVADAKIRTNKIAVNVFIVISTSILVFLGYWCILIHYAI